MDGKLLDMHGLMGDAVGFNDIELMSINLESECRKPRDVDDSESMKLFNVR